MTTKRKPRPDQKAKAERLLAGFRAGSTWPPPGSPHFIAQLRRRVRERLKLAPYTLGCQEYLLPIDPALETMCEGARRGDRAFALELRDYLQSQGVPVPAPLVEMTADPPERDVAPESLYARTRAACGKFVDENWRIDTFGTDEYAAARWLQEQYCPELREPGFGLQRLRLLHDTFPDEATWKDRQYDFLRMWEDYQQRPNAEKEAERAARGGPPRKRRQLVPLSRLQLDGGTQPRAKLDEATIDEYAEAMESGAEFPPAKAVHDGQDFWLTEGFHRAHARRKAGYDNIDCEITDGTVEDARWQALAANQTHGLRRSNADKRHAVETALRMKPDLTDRAIADHCGVSPTLVGTVRGQLTVNGLQSPVRTGRDGRTIHVGNIGRRPAGEPAATEADNPAAQTTSTMDEPAGGAAERTGGSPAEEAPRRPDEPGAGAPEVPQESGGQGGPPQPGDAAPPSPTAEGRPLADEATNVIDGARPVEGASGGVMHGDLSGGDDSAGRAPERTEEVPPAQPPIAPTTATPAPAAAAGQAAQTARPAVDAAQPEGGSSGSGSGSRPAETPADIQDEQGSRTGAPSPQVARPNINPASPGICTVEFLLDASAKARAALSEYTHLLLEPLPQLLPQMDTNCRERLRADSLAMKQSISSIRGIVSSLDD